MFVHLGGTLGLFTGMSIMSMIEAIFWLFKFINKISTQVMRYSKPQETISPLE